METKEKHKIYRDFLLNRDIQDILQDTRYKIQDTRYKTQDTRFYTVYRC